MNGLEWKYMSKSSKLIHLEHPEKNSISLCGIDWEYFYPNDTTDDLQRCKRCLKIRQLKELNK